MGIFMRFRFALLALFGSVAVSHAARLKKSDLVLDETPMTIRVITGQTANLPCRADPRYTEEHPDLYKVIWVSPLQTAISIQRQRILNDARLTLERPGLYDWNIHIRNVSLTDAGMYKCQINTDPVRTKVVTLIVQEPPSIIDHTAPSNIERPEGETVELFCNATGTPPPNITWYRLNKKTSRVREHVGFSGEALVIHNISRICADSYECVADNNVGNNISHFFKVTVQYPPEIHLPNTRLGQYVGKDTILECEVNAYPLGKVIWKRNGETLGNTRKQELTLYNKADDIVILSLRLQRIKPSDFGEYECYADNVQGITSKRMVLYETFKRTTTTTTTTPPPQSWNKHQEILAVDGSSKVNPLHHLNTYPSGQRKGSGRYDNSRHPDRQGGNHYRHRANSNDGALRSGNSRKHGPSDGSSKYTGVIANDLDRNVGRHLFPLAGQLLVVLGVIITLVNRRALVF